MNEAGSILALKHKDLDVSLRDLTSHDFIADEHAGVNKGFKSLAVLKQVLLTWGKIGELYQEGVVPLYYISLFNVPGVPPHVLRESLVEKPSNWSEDDSWMGGGLSYGTEGIFLTFFVNNIKIKDIKLEVCYTTHPKLCIQMEEIEEIKAKKDHPEVSPKGPIENNESKNKSSGLASEKIGKEEERVSALKRILG